MSQRRIPPYALDKPGERVLLLGNQAIARGFLEGGGQIASSYPGTPASEILETIADFAEMYGIYAEWADNERVAFEVCAGAAVCGLRAMCSMKHIGVNWAMDPLMHFNLRNPTGGFILVSGDDPSQHSSANEQDNRFIARMACIPCFEPSDPAEAKDMAAKLFEVSEAFRLPVMLRVTTRLCHVRGDVVLGPINMERRKGKMAPDISWRTTTRVRDIPPHKPLHDKEEKIKELAETLQWNRVEGTGDERIGVIASGVSYNYAREAIDKLGLNGKVSLLKLAITYPLPERLISNFIGDLEKLLVVEELEPFVELQVKALSKDSNPKLEIYGKLDPNRKLIPREFELNTEIVSNALSDLLGIPRLFTPSQSGEAQALASMVTPRGLTMCAGCPHRATGYALKQALRKLKVDEYTVIGDIGCYGMLSYPPLRLIDTYLGMGSSVGMSQGCARATGKLSIGIIGDSTFLHAGIPGLISAVWNNTNIKLVICDNQATAMTGFQPHPGTGITAMGKQGNKVDIESVVRGVGVKMVETIDPYSVSQSIEAFMRALEFEGPAVVISKRICATEAVRIARRQRVTLKPYRVDPEKCTGCRTCINTFGCPALVYDASKNKVWIDPVLCMGCSVCAQICPFQAISQGE
jgi:indolepyruvate ferredoxin oxidoreductase alpha subunit